MTAPPVQLVATQTGANYYFGGKLIKNTSGYLAADRMGSIGKYYPYGQEKPSATTNGTEKFTGYMRDAETGLDYAMNRYHSPGTGRLLTPDPYAATWSGRGKSCLYPAKGAVTMAFTTPTVLTVLLPA